MAIIDCIIWQPQGQEIIYAHHYPQNNLSTYTQLVVQESQVALLFSKGKLLEKFGPGKRTLDTENLPILRTLFGFPFGGKNPFTAEVWFVNLTETFNIPWSISHLSIHDPDYNTQLPLSASGQYGLKVIEPEKFLIKVVGSRYEFTQRDMTAQFTGEFTTKVKSALVQFMMQNKVGFKQISGFLDTLSGHVLQQMNQFWNELGIELTKFYISNIDIDTSTPEGQKVKQAIAEQSSMSITGHTWQQSQMFNTANSAIGQMGNMGGGSTGSLLGGLMAINMMGGMNGGGMGGAAMAPQYNQPTFGPNNQAPNAGNSGAPQQGGGQQPRMVYCSACAKRFPNNMTFCPNCGHKYNPCPNCGTDNPDDARRCVSCGMQLSGGANKCPHCHTIVPQGATFCPGCGQPIISNSNVCSRCGAEIPAGARFCPRCGNRRD
jgi:membrane protease subunit (stomatin/prohibitin family)